MSWNNFFSVQVFSYTANLAAVLTIESPVKIVHGIEESVQSDGNQVWGQKTPMIKEMLYWILSKNKLFIAVFFITAGIQVLFVEVGGRVTSTTHLDAVQWFSCIAIGFISLPLGMYLNLIFAYIVFHARIYFCAFFIFFVHIFERF